MAQSIPDTYRSSWRKYLPKLTNGSPLTTGFYHFIIKCFTLPAMRMKIYIIYETKFILKKAVLSWKKNVSTFHNPQNDNAYRT